MGELAAYLAWTILVPAAAASAAIALAGPWRRRPGRAALAVAAAVPAAFALSFVFEVDGAAILRQLPIERPEDDAPFERWHRLGLLAVALAAAAPAVAAAATKIPPSVRTPLAGGTLAIAAALALDVPGSTPAVRAGVAATCLAATLILARCTIGWLLAAAAAAQAALAVAAGASGFPSLAVTGGAAAAALALALGATTLGGQRDAASEAAGTLAPALSCGVLLGLVSWCGWSYAATGFPAWLMPATAVVVPAIAWSACLLAARRG